MNSKVTYHQQVSYCGKPRCRKCREGTGHGPYWYAYQTIDGRTTRTYVGKELPAEVRAEMESFQPPPIYSQELEQASIRIYTLGQFRLERRTGRSPDWQAVTDPTWQHQRARSVLCCLVSAPARKLAREQIMEALWPDQNLETAAGHLDRAIHDLRKIFEPARSRPATSPLLLTEREVVVLAEQPVIWLDADSFEKLLAQARETRDPGQKERLFEEAMMLYGGHFLPEERKLEWTLARRESLQRSWVGLLLDLADLRIEREALNSAIEPLDRLLSIDPTNEAAVQRLISLLAQLGRRGEALRAYKRLAAVLQQEYRIAPLPETRALYEAVRAGGQAGHNGASRPGAAPSAGTPSVGAPPGSAGARLAQRAFPVPQTGSPLRPPGSHPQSPGSLERPPVINIGRTHQSPLVGREQELGALLGLITATEQETRFKLPVQKKTSLYALDTQRRPQCMLLMGEVGIGKTRLAEEASRDARRRGWAVAWSRVYAQEGSIPYRLWTEVLRKAMAQGAWQRQELSRRPLVFQPLAALLPELQSLLPQVAFPSALPPEQEQLRLWEAARELLTLIAESTPLLIALDDLQWADSSSCELLAYLARRVHGQPIVIVGTCREHELPANHPLRPLLTDLQRERAVESLPLQPLSDEQIDALVSYMPHLPERIIERIRERAAGNPFFAEELARSIEAQIIAAGDRDGIDLDVLLPETITAVLDLRLERLSSACQRLLAKAAVLGGSFEFQVINEMEANTPGSDEDIVLELLEEGLRSGMLTEEGVGTRITYQFWHPLLVSHLYERLSAARRASLHRRAADILRRAYQRPEEEQEHAATITHHLVNGGADDALIARYAEMAGDHAYGLSSYPDAERHYRITLARLPDSPQEQLHRAELLELLGECTRIQGKYESARRFYEQALEVRSQVSVSNADLLQEAQIQAMLWCEIGWTWYDTGDNTKARLYYERGEQTLQEAGAMTGSARARLRFEESYAYWREGKYEEAQRKALEALKLFEEAIEQRKQSLESPSRSTRTRRTLAGDPIDIGRAHVLLGLNANGAGRSTEAITHWTTSLALYEQYESPREIAIVCCDLGDVYVRKAEYAQAQAVLRRSLSLAERIGELPLVSFVFGNLGWLDSRCGNLVEAEAELNRSIALTEQINYLMGLSMWYSCLATALLDQGKLAEAATALRRAFAFGRAQHNTPYTGMALVALGHLRIAQAQNIEMSEDPAAQREQQRAHMLFRARRALRRAVALEEIEAETRIEGQAALAEAAFLAGALDEARRQADTALAEAQRCELTWLAARANRILGAILAAQGQRDQAGQAFAQALQTCEQCGMRLEFARTHLQHGLALLQSPNVKDRQRRLGLESLHEAHRIFNECHAALDVQAAARAIAQYDRDDPRDLARRPRDV
jgi:predicted ATPase/two-component SAPR family response regulator